MAFDVGFLDVMTTVVTVRGPSARDNYGKTTWAATVPCRAKVSLVVRRVIRPNGENVSSTATVWAPPAGYVVDSTTTPTFTTEWQVFLNNSWRPLLAVNAPYDEDGVAHHQKLMVE